VARWEEATKLSSGNLKAGYWLKKAKKELAEEHFQRGQKAYRQRKLSETLDQWYAALALNPKYPRLIESISKVEAEARETDANEKLQTALNLYSQGQTGEALKMLDKVLEVGPGNVKAQKLQAEIRSEVASLHATQGRDYYESRKYSEAIAEWKTAMTYGYDAKAGEQLIARAKDQIKKEEAAKKRAVELTKEREEKAKKEAEEKAKKEAEEKAEAKAGPKPGGLSEEARRSSQQHYLSGVIFFQKGDYEKARDEWNLAKQLDPGNPDAQAGLERIEKILGGGQ
jgi:tetratricopeptide (TPR) repeat protein